MYRDGPKTAAQYWVYLHPGRREVDVVTTDVGSHAQGSERYSLLMKTQNTVKEHYCQQRHIFKPFAFQQQIIAGYYTRTFILRVREVPRSLDRKTWVGSRAGVIADTYCRMFWKKLRGVVPNWAEIAHPFVFICAFGLPYCCDAFEYQ